MTTHVIGTNSIRVNTGVCDYLSRRTDVGDVVHVVNSHLGGDDTDSEDICDSEDALSVAVPRLGDLVNVGTHQYIRGNDVTDDTLQCADEHDTGEIVIGIQKRNPTSKIVFGSTA